MTINVYHHFPDKGKDELMVKFFETLNLLKSKIEIMSQKGDEIKADTALIKENLANLSADLDRIATQIEGGLTAEEATSVAAEVKDLAASTKALADRNPEPPTP
jgi:methyl-accepting chemotaxis protein